MRLWKKIRHHFESLACRTLARSIPMLSRQRCISLAHLLGTLAFHIDRRGRKVAIDNIACAFGDRHSPGERIRIAHASYRNFARTMLDLFWARRLTTENFSDWIRLEGFDELRSTLSQTNRSCVLMCVHQGNWEWANLGTGFFGVHTLTLAENFKNPSLTSVFSTAREHSGMKIIAQENSMLRMLRAALRGQALGMLVDLTLPPTQAATIIEAFGMEICVPILHAVLAQRANTALVPVLTEPLPNGQCRVKALAPVSFPSDASPREIAQRCWNQFEPFLHARPELYLWSYKHFRYRPRHTARRFPAYSNESILFEHLRASSVEQHPTR